MRRRHLCRHAMPYAWRGLCYLPGMGNRRAQLRSLWGERRSISRGDEVEAIDRILQRPDIRSMMRCLTRPDTRRLDWDHTPPQPLFVGRHSFHSVLLPTRDNGMAP